MIILLKHKVREADQRQLLHYIESQGEIIHKEEKLLVLREDIPEPDILYRYKAVAKVITRQSSCTLVCAGNSKPEIVIRGNTIGHGDLTIIAGPCTIDDTGRLRETAHALSEEGIKFMRGGVQKLRTSPYSYSGAGLKALETFASIAKELELITVSEVISPEWIVPMTEHIDILQVGTRNMYNYPLLKALGKAGRPVILKRAVSATYKEWLLAAEHLAVAGNREIILCERGIRTFETSLRNTPDIAAIPVMKERSCLPIIFDPSHATGDRRFVLPLSYAAVAAGVDGLLLEVEINPQSAPVDGGQTINIEELRRIMRKLPSLIVQ
ncbi:MAG: 3-deoxy-7-phosphoheptulonate synthase [Candidatus Cloacimonetes bacterium]|nr:3-deoxy-7-phosphoheptulonate synthase [Candidatus Cloacimonadota bacterium]